MSETQKPKSSYEAMTENQPEGESKKSEEKKEHASKTDKKSPSAKENKPDDGHDSPVQIQLESQVQQLKDELQKKEGEIKDLKLRNLADINNIQERYSRESANTKTYAHQYFAKDILDVVDALEQAEQSLEGQQKEGIVLITDMLKKAFAKHGIETIDPQDEPYDHRHHEAMAMQPNADMKDNHIMQVIQKGYKIKDRLLRAARVIVAKNG